jgi:predicted MFS family arabinose efflux permease
MATFAGPAAAVGDILAVVPALVGAPAIVGLRLVAWGVLWGLVPLAMQTDVLSGTPDAPEASSAVLISVLPLGDRDLAGLGGVVVTPRA